MPACCYAKGYLKALFYFSGSLFSYNFGLASSRVEAVFLQNAVAFARADEV